MKFKDFKPIPKKLVDMKELTLQDLDDGIIVVLPDNSRYKVHRTNYTVDMSEWSAVLNKLQITLEGRPQPVIKQLPTQENNIMSDNYSPGYPDLKKSDLTTGLRVKLRNGWTLNTMIDAPTYLHPNLRNCFVSINGQRIVSLAYYNQDLTYSESYAFFDEYDVMEIYRPRTSVGYNSSSFDDLILIWKREEKSPEQIAYEQLQAQIADEETRHNESMKALREQAEKLKPKG